MPNVRVAITVTGRVQGVGFRYFTSNCAAKHRLTGWVLNGADGTVRMEVQGAADDLDKFKKNIREGPVFACVREVLETRLPVVEGEQHFSVRH